MSEQKAFTEKGLFNHSPSEEVGFWLKCDIKAISPEIARSTDVLSLPLNHHVITPEKVSANSRSVAKREGRNKLSIVRKFIPSHLPQVNYLIPLRNFQLSMRLGLQVEKFHAVYQYRQSRYKKDFITKNIDQRRRAGCPISAPSFKLINNAIYAKCLMDLSRCSLLLPYSNNRSKFLKSMQNPYMTLVTSLGKDCVLVTHKKPLLHVKQATYVGFAILEHAKYVAYDTYDNALKRAYHVRQNLLYSDTESFILKQQCDHLEETPLKV